MAKTIFNRTFLVGVLLVILFVFSACQPPTPIKEQKDISSAQQLVTELESTQEIKKFSSEEELRLFLASSAANQVSSFARSFELSRMAFDDADFAVAESAPMAATKAGGAGFEGASEYSETNVQVQGVDEADIVKNDGKHIYTIVQDKVVIVDAFPADNAEIVSELEFKGNPRNLFVNGDRLVVFVDTNDEIVRINEYDFIPRPVYMQSVHVFVYDISDRSKPEEVADYNMEGWYFQSRMIGDHVYFIAKKNIYNYYNPVPLPEFPIIRESSTIIARPEVFYFDNPEDNYVFHTFAAFDVNDENSLNAQTFMLGHSNNLYVSPENIYITYQKNLPYRYYERHNEDRFHDVVVPLLPEEVRSKINTIKVDSSLNPFEKWDEISKVLEEHYNSLSERAKNTLFEEISDAIEEYEIQLEVERRKTIVQKIAISDGRFRHEARGEVSGHPLNQFSMDEYKDNFRIATTTNIWRGEVTTYNNVFVMNEDLNVIGKIENIAPDERIFSTRFMGDRLYMVTFQRIDPFFVIDLSQPTNPKILGELKIPGFSDYLHPYDENHIIGIGKETETNQWGGVSVGGVKIALFDVSDVTKPKEMDTIQIGQPGSDSEALRDHKAFLFDKEKNILVIPLREVKGKRYYDNRRGYYQQRVWQGAYVFGLTPEDGISIKGKISHSIGDEDYRYYWGSPNAVRRSLYMDDVLYTISPSLILANDLDDLETELGEVELPYKERNYYPYPTPFRGDVIEVEGEVIR